MKVHEIFALFPTSEVRESEEDETRFPSVWMKQHKLSGKKPLRAFKSLPEPFFSPPVFCPPHPVHHETLKSSTTTTEHHRSLHLHPLIRPSSSPNLALFHCAHFKHKIHKNLCFYVDFCESIQEVQVLLCNKTQLWFYALYWKLLLTCVYTYICMFHVS